MLGRILPDAGWWRHQLMTSAAGIPATRVAPIMSAGSWTALYSTSSVVTQRPVLRSAWCNCFFRRVSGPWSETKSFMCFSRKHRVMCCVHLFFSIFISFSHCLGNNDNLHAVLFFLFHFLSFFFFLELKLYNSRTKIINRNAPIAGGVFFFPSPVVINGESKRTGKNGRHGGGWRHDCHLIGRRWPVPLSLAAG